MELSSLILSVFSYGGHMQWQLDAVGSQNPIQSAWSLNATARPIESSSVVPINWNAQSQLGPVPFLLVWLLGPMPLCLYPCTRVPKSSGHVDWSLHCLPPPELVIATHFLICIAHWRKQANARANMMAELLSVFRMFCSMHEVDEERGLGAFNFLDVLYCLLVLLTLVSTCSTFALHH